MKKLLGSSVVVIGLLLAGPQKASTDTLVGCINPGATLSGLYIANSGNCPAPGGVSWTQVNLTTTSGQASNVRSTPPVFMEGDQGLLVGVTNIGTVPHKIKAEVIDSSGKSFVMLDGTVPLNPNNSTGGSKGFAGFNFVKFTVLDGTRDDIRANAQELLGGGVVGSFLVAE